MPLHAIQTGATCEMSDVKPLDFQPYRRAIQHICRVLAQTRRIGVIVGPSRSGKTEIIKQFVRDLRPGMVSVLVNGDNLTREVLFAALLRAMHFRSDALTGAEMHTLLQVVVDQRVRLDTAPILIVENVDRMSRPTLRILGVLAGYNNNGYPAIRMVLTGQSGCEQQWSTTAISNLSKSTTDVYHLAPMTRQEVLVYLHRRLRSSGVQLPDEIFPIEVCDRLHEMSGGWPGRLDTYALRALRAFRHRGSRPAIAWTISTSGVQISETSD